jgi:hypothetical protein
LVKISALFTSALEVTLSGPPSSVAPKFFVVKSYLLECKKIFDWECLKKVHCVNALLLESAISMLLKGQFIKGKNIKDF